MGKDLQTGKKIVKVTSAIDDPIPGVESFPVPCGNCIGCRLDYSRQWADRCMMEAKYHERSCFITLTYNSEHVPRSYYSINGHRSSVPALTLCKRDLQLFFKRFRQAFAPSRIRYFGCGEYGPTTLRPHYHLVIFGVDFDDKVWYNKSKSNQDVWTSPSLDKLWSFPPRLVLGESHSPNSEEDEDKDKFTLAGIATVQPMTWETCAYTARYVTKKLKGPWASFYTERGMEPPFIVMSRRPGIGRRYYEDHPDLWNYDYINISTPDGGKKFRPPRYFMKLLEQQDPYSAEAMKEVRKAFAVQQSMTLEQLSRMEHDEYLNLQAHTAEGRIKSLQRSAI